MKHETYYRKHAIWFGRHSGAVSSHVDRFATLHHTHDHAGRIFHPERERQGFRTALGLSHDLRSSIRGCQRPGLQP